MSLVETAASEVILVGVHGSGKTTLGRQLAHDLKIPFHAELGREAMERRGPESATVDAGAGFDAALWDAEWVRDQRAGQELRAARGVRRVIETWHVGNAAYAIRRPDSSVQRDWRRELAARLADHDVPILVQHLRVDRPTFDRRYSEHRGGSESAQRAFLWSVGEVLAELVAELAASGRGITVVPSIDTSACTVRAAGDAILAALRRAEVGSWAGHTQ